MGFGDNIVIDRENLNCSFCSLGRLVSVD